MVMVRLITRLCLAAALVGASALAQDATTTTTTTTTADGVTRTVVKDGNGNVLSETTDTSGPAAGGSAWSTSWSTAPSSGAVRTPSSAPPASRVPAASSVAPATTAPAPTTTRPATTTTTPAPSKTTPAPTTSRPLAVSRVPSARPTPTPTPTPSTDSTKDGGPMTIATPPPTKDGGPMTIATPPPTKDGGPMTVATPPPTKDGGPMTISTQTPQAPQPQSPQATPAPQATQAPQPANPQVTPAPQTSTPKPNAATPKPTPKPVPATSTPKPTTQPPSDDSPEPSSETPGPSSNEEKKTDEPKTSPVPGSTPAPSTSKTPSTTPTQPGSSPAPPGTPAVPATPAASSANGGAAAATPAAPVDATPGIVGPAGAVSSDDQATTSTSGSDKETPAPSTATPLSESESISNGSPRGSTGSSWGVVVVVAGVICALVGISGFALVNRRRKAMEDQDDKTDRNANNHSLDFEAGVTPADVRAQRGGSHAAPMVPPPAPAALSPQRVSYNFRRASDAPARQGAMPTPMNNAAMARPTPFSNGPSTVVAPAAVPMGPSILDQSRESATSTFSRPSRASSDGSFISSASVAPPMVANPYSSVSVSSEATIDEDVAPASSFVPTDSFTASMTKTSLNDSIVSSNMDFEFGEDSTFHAVPRRTGTIVGRQSRASSAAQQVQPDEAARPPPPPQQQPMPTASIASSVDSSSSLMSSAYSINVMDDETDAAKGSYDFDVDGLSDDDMDMDDNDEQIDFDTDSNSGSFAHSAYKPRDDSYSDDYRGSDAGSAIRGSNDSLFSRASSDFGRSSSDSLA